MSYVTRLARLVPLIDSVNYRAEQVSSLKDKIYNNINRKYQYAEIELESNGVVVHYCDKYSFKRVDSDFIPAIDLDKSIDELYTEFINKIHEEALKENDAINKKRAKQKEALRQAEINELKRLSEKYRNENISK